MNCWVDPAVSDGLGALTWIDFRTTLVVGGVLVFELEVVVEAPPPPHAVITPIVIIARANDGRYRRNFVIELCLASDSK